MDKRSAIHHLSCGTEAGGLRFAYPPYEDWRVYIESLNPEWNPFNLDGRKKRAALAAAFFQRCAIRTTKERTASAM